MTLWLDGQRSTGPTYIISSPPPEIVGLIRLDYPLCARRKWSGAHSVLGSSKLRCPRLEVSAHNFLTRFPGHLLIRRLSSHGPSVS